MIFWNESTNLPTHFNKNIYLIYSFKLIKLINIKNKDKIINYTRRYEQYYIKILLNFYLLLNLFFAFFFRSELISNNSVSLFYLLDNVSNVLKIKIIINTYIVLMKNILN